MHWLYLGVLVACLVVTLPLELVLHARVYARWPRLLLTLVPVLAVFVAWDSAAIHARWWSYTRSMITGWHIGNVPVEELAFFVVVPICSILTYEAVGRVRRR
jgi:lycopene cyclase domain-containing protein